MTPNNLEKLLSSPEQFKEIWIEGDKGQRICALINNDIGWLMYLRYEGDAGYSTRNPSIETKEEIEFVLDNGQREVYPKNWTYPLSILKSALLSFMNNSELPNQVSWHDDSA